MIYFLHGDNLVSSRNFLKELVDQAKAKKQEIIRLNGISLKPEDLIQALDSQSLFNDDRLVIVEQLFSRPKSLELGQIFAFLKKFTTESDLILWEKKEIGKVLQRNLPLKTQIKLFKTPALMFKFLDQVMPQTKTQALKILHDLCQTESAELVFYMLSRQFRLLLLTSQKQKIPGPVWIVGKLKKQANSFSSKQLLTIYNQLFRIDEQIKTGQTLMPLAWHLDMLLLGL